MYGINITDKFLISTECDLQALRASLKKISSSVYSMQVMIPLHHYASVLL